MKTKSLIFFLFFTFSICCFAQTDSSNQVLNKINLNNYINLKASVLIKSLKDSGYTISSIEPIHNMEHFFLIYGFTIKINNFLTIEILFPEEERWQRFRYPAKKVTKKYLNKHIKLINVKKVIHPSSL